MHSGWYDRTRRRVRDLSCGPYRIYLEFEVRRVLCRSCQAVKRERLSFLTDGALHTKRFAYYVGRRCRSATIKDIAAELHLGWDSVKELDKQYMRAANGLEVDLHRGCGKGFPEEASIGAQGLNNGIKQHGRSNRLD